MRPDDKKTSDFARFSLIGLCVFSTSVICCQNRPAFASRKHRPFHSRSGARRTSRRSASPIEAITGDDGNNEHEKYSVDRAPCFDGMCASDPDSVGEATLRLGGKMTGPTVWSEFGRVALENPDLANLGQGFPDWLPPQFAVDSLVEAAMDVAQSPHQYTRTAGHPNLVRQLARRYSVHLHRDIDPMAEIAVTVGASQALYLSLQTLIKPGDEVILFEPFFDLYVNQVKLAGGTPIFVPLTFVPYKEDNGDDVITGGEWELRPGNLQQAISTRTRAIILNSPHNPTGKVFTRTEMMYIADAVQTAGQDCVVLSDEVYKYIVHSPPKEESVSDEELFKGANAVHPANPTSTSTVTCPGHVHFASLPGMWDRTITISSAGKTFSATGWQVGWCVGPERLISPIHQLLPYVQFCASTVIQEALARTLPKADGPYEEYSSYYEYLKAKYTRKRDLLATALNAAGFAVPDYSVTPGGGFFIFARIGKGITKAIPQEKINVKNRAAPDGIARKDWALCQWMAEERGVLCIPSSPFFSEKSVAAGVSEEFVRIAFCKTDETIEAAARAFLALSGDRTRSGAPVDNKENGAEYHVDGRLMEVAEVGKGGENAKLNLP